MVTQAQDFISSDPQWSELYGSPVTSAEAHEIRRNLAAFTKLLLRLDRRSKIGQQPNKGTS